MHYHLNATAKIFINVVDEDDLGPAFESAFYYEVISKAIYMVKNCNEIFIKILVIL